MRLPTLAVRTTYAARIASALAAVALLLVATTSTGQSTATKRPAGETIIVSGASGQLGDLVVKELLSRGVPAADLILVSRTPDELKAYAAQGASVRFGDFTKPESLAAAFKGGTRLVLISISGGGVSRPEAHAAAIHAAASAGVKQIAYTSWIGLSRGDASGIGADHQKTEDALRASGIEWTMLRNSLYADNLVEQAIQMAKSGRATAAPTATGIGYVTRQDCAVAAAVVVTTPGHGGKVYDITGPELVSTRDLAAMVQKLTGRPVEVVPPDPNAPRSGRGGGFGGASLAIVSTHVADLKGRPATSVPQLLEANRKAIEAK